MNIYEGLTIATFVIVVVLMISQYLDTSTPKLSDVLALLNIQPCYEVKVYRNGKRLRRNEYMVYLTSSVHYIEFKDGILYIQIF
nr:MAG TPA: hypothetical protein [Bacteriophage sp.]